jgi:hypothetical protein
MVNKKLIFKETEPDIVLDPASYWRLLLHPRVEELLKKNIIPPRSVRANNTNVVVLSFPKVLQILGATQKLLCWRAKSGQKLDSPTAWIVGI